MTKMCFLNKMKPMRFFVSLMLLSIVVQDTDSCSSTIGWRSSQEAIPPQLDEKQLITTLPSVVKTHRPKIMPHKDNEPCPHPLDKEFCTNDGKCFMLLNEPYCNCAEGWKGRRCMEKSLDGYYNVIVPKTASTSTSSTTTPASSTIIDTSTINSDLKNVPVSKCPKQYDLEYCLNGGKCLMFHLGSFMCLCKHPFFGLRCEEKSLEGEYNLRMNRTRRRVLVYNPNKKFPSYYEPRSKKASSS